MKRISLAILGCFFQLFGAFAQNADTIYKARKLKLEEVNFVSSYYKQDGNNSAVTGGIGSEDLSDIANTIEVTLLKTDKRNRQFAWNIGIGIDHYTSASSDKIDPNTVSSASTSDTRIYPSLSWSEKDKKGNTFGIEASYSTEFDYQSFGAGLNYARISKDNNREFSVRLQSYFDKWSIIYPIELRNGGYPGYTNELRVPRNSYSASLVYSQVVNRRLQLAALLDFIYQEGLLATNYQRVYFADGSERIEYLPDKRLKIPLGIRINTFLNDRFIIRAWYRFYWDDWAVTAHTANIELPVKLNAFISINGFYRFYTQTAADYFAAYRNHITSEVFYTSDYDLSEFNSHFVGAGIRLAPERGILKIKHFTSLELRYGHYMRSTGLHADIITLNAGFK